MKKLMVVILTMLLSLNLIAQIKGVDFKQAQAINKNSDAFPFEKLIKGDDFYAIPFEHTPVGIKHCLEKVDELLSLNSLNFSKPDINNELYASYCNGITDYENLDLSLGSGGSEVKRQWFLPNKYKISLWLTKDVICIYFHSPDK